MAILEWASAEENRQEMADIRRLFRCTPFEAALLLMLGQVSENVEALGSEMTLWSAPGLIVEDGLDEEDMEDE